MARRAAAVHPELPRAVLRAEVLWAAVRAEAHPAVPQGAVRAEAHPAALRAAVQVAAHMAEVQTEVRPAVHRAVHRPAVHPERAPTAAVREHPGPHRKREIHRISLFISAVQPLHSA